jgi:hypothetical protein
VIVVEVILINKKLSSEKRLNLPAQPPLTCPMIDSVINSLHNIGEYDDDDELIEIQADYSSLNSALDNAEEISSWINAWIDLAEENLECELTQIKKNMEEDIECEHTEMYSDIDYIDFALKDTTDTIKEGRKEIKRLYNDLDHLKSSIESTIDNNDSSAFSELESFRTSVEDLRSTAQHFKDILKEHILEFLPELAGEKTAYEQFTRNKLQENIKKNNFIINWANEDDAERPNNFHDDNYVLINVNIKDITKYMHSSMRLDLDDIKGGDNAIGNRLERAKQHIINGCPIDYPEVGCSDINNVIDYTNGRHRVVAAYQLGFDYAPMFVYKPTLDKFKSLVKTKEIDNTLLNFLNNKITDKNNILIKKPKF